MNGQYTASGFKDRLDGVLARHAVRPLVGMGRPRRRFGLPALGAGSLDALYREAQRNSKAGMRVDFPTGERDPIMIDDVYNAHILEFAGNIPRLGRLDAPDATARAHSKLCGSTVTVDLKMKDGVVIDFAHDVKACALGQASSSIMARNIVGATAGELRALRETMRRMLKENGPPPEGRFADLRFLEPVRDYKARHASTMLTFEAVIDAIDQIEKRTAEAAA